MRNAYAVLVVLASLGGVSGGCGSGDLAPDRSGPGAAGSGATASGEIGGSFGPASSGAAGTSVNGGVSSGGATVAAGGTAAPVTGGLGSTACEVGLTRQCYGPGACAGAQICQADGSWSACDCGAGSGGAGTAGAPPSHGGQVAAGGIVATGGIMTTGGVGVGGSTPPASGGVGVGGTPPGSGGVGVAGSLPQGGSPPLGTGGVGVGGSVAMGGTGGAATTPDCATFIDIGTDTRTPQLGTTGAVCYRSSAPDQIAQMGTANCTGRTVSVNGQDVGCFESVGDCNGPFPAKSSDGYWYVFVSAGTLDYCSVYWW